MLMTERFQKEKKSRENSSAENTHTGSGRSGQSSRLSGREKGIQSR